MYTKGYYIEKCPYSGDFYIMRHGVFEVFGIISKNSKGWWVCEGPYAS